MLAQDCDFKDPEEMIRDRIVFGTKSLKVREKLIAKGAKLTLDKAIEIARSFESSQAQLTAMATENVDGSIHLVQTQDKKKHRITNTKPILYSISNLPNLLREQNHAETVVALTTRLSGAQHVVRHASIVRSWVIL